MAVNDILECAFDGGFRLRLPGATNDLIADTAPDATLMELASRLGLCFNGPLVSENLLRTVAVLVYARRPGEEEVPLARMLKLGFPGRATLAAELAKHFALPRTANDLDRYMVLSSSWQNGARLNPRIAVVGHDRSLDTYVRVGAVPMVPAREPDVRSVDEALVRAASHDAAGWPRRAWTTLAAALVDLDGISDAARGELWRAIIGIELQLGDRRLAKIHIDWYTALARRGRSQLAVIDALHLRGIMALQRDDHDEAIKLNDDARDRLQRLRRRQLLEAQAYFRRLSGINGSIGEAYLRRRFKQEATLAPFITKTDNPDSKASLVNLNQAHAAAEKLGDPSEFARSCMRLGRRALRHLRPTAVDREWIAVAERERPRMSIYSGFIHDRTVVSRRYHLATDPAEAAHWGLALVAIAIALDHRGFSEQVKRIDRAFRIGSSVPVRRS